jgi:hypothetical protein
MESGQFLIELWHELKHRLGQVILHVERHPDNDGA